MLVLGVCWVVIEKTWTENYGDKVEEAVSALSPVRLRSHSPRTPSLLANCLRLLQCVLPAAASAADI